MREENYIVRIYRRGRNDLLVGIIETPDGQSQQPFRSAQELASLLATPRARKAKQRTRREAGSDEGSI